MKIRRANCGKMWNQFSYMHIHTYIYINIYSPVSVHAFIVLFIIWSSPRNGNIRMKNEHMFVCLITAPASLPIIKIATSFYTKQMSKAITQPEGCSWTVFIFLQLRSQGRTSICVLSTLGHCTAASAVDP